LNEPVTKKPASILILPAMAALLFACAPVPATPSPVAIPSAATASITALITAIPSQMSTPVFAPVFTPGGGACEIVADGGVAIYQRPSIASDLFGTLTPDDRMQVAAYTADGWFGFDPGVAQAANVGVFRNRWVQWGAAFHMEGACDGLPLVVGPPPGICFLMASTDTPVYASPDVSSAVIAAIHLDDYAKAIGRMTGWFKVDLSVGSTGILQQGWIIEDLANLNGSCDGLPALTP
jgi:hypothetical protein